MVIAVREVQVQLLLEEDVTEVMPWRALQPAAFLPVLGKTTVSLRLLVPLDCVTTSHLHSVPLPPRTAPATLAAPSCGPPQSPPVFFANAAPPRTRQSCPHSSAILHMPSPSALSLFALSLRLQMAELHRLCYRAHRNHMTTHSALA